VLWMWLPHHVACRSMSNLPALVADLQCGRGPPTTPCKVKEELWIRLPLLVVTTMPEHTITIGASLTNVLEPATTTFHYSVISLRSRNMTMKGLHQAFGPSMSYYSRYGCLVGKLEF
jgi:hypothetical protein